MGAAPDRNGSSLGPNRGEKRPHRASLSVELGATEYEDFVLFGRRRDARTVEMRVYASSAGSQQKPAVVTFPEAEADKIRRNFYSDPEDLKSGRGTITMAQATVLGKRL